MDDLASATRKLMERKNWNADRLAKEAGLARSTVFNLLGGNDVDLTTVRKLKKLGVKHPLVQAA